jgi:hypothetical protein
VRSGRRSGVPGPPPGLPVEHSQLVVDGLVLRGHLLLLLRGKVPQHSVYGRHLQQRIDARVSSSNQNSETTCLTDVTTAEILLTVPLR